MVKTEYEIVSSFWEQAEMSMTLLASAHRGKDVIFTDLDQIKTFLFFHFL